MKTFKIERNKLDYILTDILPVELPETFTFNYLYNFLEKNHLEIDALIKEFTILKYKINDKQKLFECNLWKTSPLKFNILKPNNKYRELSVTNPLSAINIYIFIELYQKEILNLLEKKSIFSLRFHTKNNNLHYVARQNGYAEYKFLKTKTSSKRIVEQTGTYFKLKKYNSLNEFMNSKLWYQCLKDYNYFGKCDYKSCFDSIYTHTYKWISAKNVSDSKGFRNCNLYTSIDRIMQNINNSTSNGIIVGPEFSRMIAELLLQQIDVEVYEQLVNEKLVHKKDYEVFRYVDDIFIFSLKKETINRIISIYEEITSHYLLKLNESKMQIYEIPFIYSNWIGEANGFAEYIKNNIFYSREDLKVQQKELEDNKAKNKSICLLKKCINFGTLKNKFNDIICHYPEKKSSIVAYVLSTLFNNLKNRDKEITIFPCDSTNKKKHAFLDLIFYCYSLYPSFENTQKLISIINLLSLELDFRDNNWPLRRVIQEYSNIIINTNSYDIINLILILRKYNISFNIYDEEKLFNKILSYDDPILLASFYVYSSYNIRYKNEILKKIENVIDIKISNIVDESHLMYYREFWYILIFYDNSDITSVIKNKMRNKIDNYTNSFQKNNPVGKVNDLFFDFIKTNTKLFFIWDISKIDIDKQIAYRTYQRSIFKKFGKKKYSLNIGSID